MPAVMTSPACALGWEGTSALILSMNILVSMPGRQPSTIASLSLRIWSRAGVSIAAWRSEDWGAAPSKIIYMHNEAPNITIVRSTMLGDGRN